MANRAMSLPALFRAAARVFVTAPLAGALAAGRPPTVFEPPEEEPYSQVFLFMSYLRLLSEPESIYPHNLSASASFLAACLLMGPTDGPHVSSLLGNRDPNGLAFVRDAISLRLPAYRFLDCSLSSCDLLVSCCFAPT